MKKLLLIPLLASCLNGNVKEKQNQSTYVAGVLKKRLPTLTCKEEPPVSDLGVVTCEGVNEKREFFSWVCTGSYLVQIACKDPIAPNLGFEVPKKQAEAVPSPAAGSAQ